MQMLSCVLAHRPAAGIGHGRTQGGEAEGASAAVSPTPRGSSNTYGRSPGCRLRLAPSRIAGRRCSGHCERAACAAPAYRCGGSTGWRSALLFPVSPGRQRRPDTVRVRSLPTAGSLAPRREAGATIYFMQEDLDLLASKVSELAKMALSLRDENQRLRTELAAASARVGDDAPARRSGVASAGRTARAAAACAGTGAGHMENVSVTILDREYRLACAPRRKKRAFVLCAVCRRQNDGFVTAARFWARIGSPSWQLYRSRIGVVQSAHRRRRRSRRPAAAGAPPATGLRRCAAAAGKAFLSCIWQVRSRIELSRVHRGQKGCTIEFPCGVRAKACSSLNRCA
jgi:hypothetical protein